MIRDESLKQMIDYSQGQKEAAYMVLGNIVNLLNAFSENIRIIGGWVPSLLYPEKEHIGSIDVDVLLNQLQIKKAESYKTIKRLLLQNGYRRHPEKYFTFVKTVSVQGVEYDVDVDFLSGKYGGDGGNVSKHVDGIKTLRCAGRRLSVWDSIGKNRRLKTELRMLLFEDLRVDEMEFANLNKKDLLELCERYHSTNLKILKKSMITVM